MEESIKKENDNKKNTISLYRTQSQSINDSMDRLAVKVYTYKVKYGKKVLMLTGCGSENGTSMVAINLAISLAYAGWKTLLVDADLRKGSRFKREGRASEQGLSELLTKGGDNWEDYVYPTNHKNFSYMPCGMAAENPVLLLCSKEMMGFFSGASNEYDFVIIDCPAVTVMPDASALILNVDGVALVCSLNKTTKKQLAAAKQEVEKQSDKYYGLVVNCVDKKQYKQFFPQQAYFEPLTLLRKHKKWILNNDTKGLSSKKPSSNDKKGDKEKEKSQVNNK